MKHWAEPVEHPPSHRASRVDTRIGQVSGVKRENWFSLQVADMKECIKHYRCYRPYAYDVTEGRPRVLGVKRGTATCAIAKHAASGPTPACHTAGLAGGRALTQAESANALCHNNTCAQRDKS